ncbi:MAG: SURF1 family protein [Proteobacteria bacterium]|nr:SURF1 family protein [Pseudomonadota bacterium]
MSFIVISSVTLLCCLGFWQLSRAKYKENLAYLQQKGAINETKPSNAFITSLPESMRYQRVILKGHFINEFTILLDNKLNKGQIGYHVVVPFQDNSMDKVILIDRGWVALGKSRQVLPSIKPIEGEVSIEGYWDFAYRNPFIKQALETDPIRWPLRMQDLDTNLLQKLTAKSVHKMLVKLDKESAYGFEILPPQTPMTSARHKAYAFQWFSLAAALFILSLFAAKRNLK